jgi:transcriptional regulator with GAF, ATPase, and Fis domain
MWVASYIEGEDKFPFFSTAQTPDDAAPDEAMREAVHREAGLLRLKRRRRGNAFAIETLLVCPLVNAGKAIGVVAVSRSTPEAVYDESDLEHFVAAAQALAPHFEAILQRDQLRRDYKHARLHGVSARVLIGDSPAMVQVRDQITQAVASRLNILILGETGTGKELAARLIHDSGPRASQPFVIVNCAAIPRKLFESELFGHEKGAFTGAHTHKPGLIEKAHGGALFLVYSFAVFIPYFVEK